MSPTLKDTLDQHREDGGDWAPDEGTYDVVVTDAEAFESKAGNLIAKFVLRLAPEQPDAGRSFDAIFSFGGRARGQATHNLSVAGVTDEQLAEIDPDEYDAIRLLDGAMRGLVGDGLTVKARARDNGDGVWVDVLSSRRRTPGSEVPADQTELAVGEAPRQHDAASDDAPF